MNQLKAYTEKDYNRCEANDLHKVEIIANMISTMGTDMDITCGPCTISILTKMDIFPFVKAITEQLNIGSCYTVDEINLKPEQKGHNLICLMFRSEFLTHFA